MEKFKLKSLQDIIPSIVTQYHGESIFDLRVNPTDMLGLLDPSSTPSHRPHASFQTRSLTLPLPMDLLVGETLVRKLLVQVTLTLVEDLSLEVSVSGLESHDVYLRPIPKEGYTGKKVVVGRFSLG